VFDEPLPAHRGVLQIALVASPSAAPEKNGGEYDEDTGGQNRKRGTRHGDDLVKMPHEKESEGEAARLARGPSTFKYKIAHFVRKYRKAGLRVRVGRAAEARRGT